MRRANKISNSSTITDRRAVLATSSLIAARTIYGVNWFNVAAVFPLIAIQFNQDIFLLGAISTAFFVGVGVFQIPAGIFALRFGPRTSAIIGIVVSSSAALFFGFASEPLQLVWLRFIVGAGMAFFFSSSITLIAAYSKGRSAGLSIGALNAAHSAGGVIGIFGWILLAEVAGWRQSIVISGAIGIISAVFMVVALPRTGSMSGRNSGRNLDSNEAKGIETNNAAAGLGDQTGSPPITQSILRDTLEILSNASLARVGIFLVGIQGAWALVLTYLVVYLQYLSVPAQLAGVITSLPLISAIVSAPLLGRLYDRIRSATRILLICGIGIGVTLASISTGSLVIITASVILTGIFSGGAFTVAYAKARSLEIFPASKIGEANAIMSGRTTGNSRAFEFNYGALKVAWINGISLVGVLWMPLVFSYAVKQLGYQGAWLLSAGLVIPFVAIPFAARRKKH